MTYLLLSPAEYSNSFGILLHGLDEPVEKLLVFRLAGPGEGGASGAEARAEVVQLLAKLLADSIFSTNTVGVARGVARSYYGY